MACSKDMGDLLKDFSLGHLKGVELDRILAHIEDCSACSDDLELLASVTTLAAERGETLLEPEMEKTLGKVAGSVFKGFMSMLRGLVAPIPIPARVLVPVAAAVFVFFAYGPLSHRDGSYHSLADLTPAPYYQVSLRGSSSEEDLLFTGAMEDYLEGDYESASRVLLHLVNTRDYSEITLFYCGVSLLLEGDAEEAAPHLERTAGSSNTKIRQASVWYLAQADLLKGDGEGAKVRLESLVIEGGEHGRKAKDQLAGLIESEGND